MSLSEQDAEAVCICAEIASPADDDEAIKTLCDAHQAAVWNLVRRHVTAAKAEALNEAWVHVDFLRLPDRRAPFPDRPDDAFGAALNRAMTVIAELADQHRPT